MSEISPRRPDYTDLIELARACVATYYGGRALVGITLEVHGLPKKVRLPVDPGVSRAAAPPAIQNVPADPLMPEQDPGRRGISQCIEDILQVLESAKRPLTTTRLMSELGRGGKEWSERYVSKLLARMVEDGTLENPEDVKPRGYRLPEWGTEQH